NQLVELDLEPGPVDPRIVHDDHRRAEDDEREAEQAAGEQPRQLRPQVGDAFDLAAGAGGAVPADADREQPERDQKQADAASERAGTDVGSADREAASLTSGH